MISSQHFREFDSRGISKAQFCDEVAEFLKFKFNTKSATALFDLYDIGKTGVRVTVKQVFVVIFVCLCKQDS